jgi:hypothetical protein
VENLPVKGFYVGVYYVMNQGSQRRPCRHWCSPKAGKLAFLLVEKSGRANAEKANFEVGLKKQVRVRY